MCTKHYPKKGNPFLNAANDILSAVGLKFIMESAHIASKKLGKKKKNNTKHLENNIDKNLSNSVVQ